ncbi:MAG: ABC transporter ATP-binding protein [Proteobacteria bacterium]|nr:ABC transporter ATP-binding protein [Pseudomonadota bacterium]
MDNYDDENFDDGFDEQALASNVNLSLWKKLFRYSAQYPKDLIWIAVCAIVTASMEVVFPLITREVVDQVSLNGLNADFTPYITAYIATTICICIGIAGFIVKAGKIRTHVSHDIRRDGFENLQRLSFSFYDYRPVGWLMARMTSDCERLSNILAWGFLDLIWGSTMMIGIALAMLVMNPKLALITLAVIPFLGWLSAKFKNRILISARSVRSTNSRITGSFNEAIMGVLTSKAFVREKANLDEFQTLTDKMYNASVTNLTLAAIYLPLVVTMASLAIGLAMAVGGMDLLMGTITAGTLVAFMAYARHFFDPVEQLGHWFAEMQMAQASAERILSLIEADPQIKDSPSVVEALRANSRRQDSAVFAADGGAARISEIELKDVGFHYDPAKPILKNINLTIRRGETVAIVGPTGGGKSTLVNLVCRFYEPTSGQVLIDGVDYRSRGLHWLQSNLGMVLQNAHVFSGSILENIRYGRLDASDEEVMSTAHIAGAHDFIMGLEAGYATNPGEGGSLLSAGQKQLVSFARAILADPQILIMDEATSSVDTETEQHIQQGLVNLLKGRIALIIAHRLSTIRNAQRIVVIDRGRIREMGTHAQLMDLGGHYYDLYRQQSLQESSQILTTPAPAV